MADMVTDANDPRLGHGVDKDKIEQHKAYLVLSDEELSKGYVRPLRMSYVCKICNTTTTMPEKCAETYARDQTFYGATYCCGCIKHLPVSNFTWKGTTEEVGS